MFLMAFLEGSIQLVPDGTIFLHILLVLLMVAVLNRTLFRPIIEILKARENESRKNLVESAELERQISSENERYRETLRSARAAGYKLVEEKRGEALREREEQLRSMRADIDQRIQRESALVAAQAEKARSSLDSSTLASMIKNQVLKPVRDGRR